MTAKMNTEYRINDTEESEELEMFGDIVKIDLTPMMFNMFCSIMNMLTNETALEEFERSLDEFYPETENEIKEFEKYEVTEKLKGYKLTEANFKMTDFETGELIGVCNVKGYNNIDCKGYKEYENSFFGIEICDFSE